MSKLEELENKISSGKFILLFSDKKNCNPCRALGPVLDKVSEEMSLKNVLMEYNPFEDTSISQKFRVRGIPTLIITEDGKVIDQTMGAMGEKQLEFFLNKHFG